MTALRHAAALPLVLVAMLACFAACQLYRLSTALGQIARKVMGPARRPYVG